MTRYDFLDTYISSILLDSYTPHVSRPSGRAPNNVSLNAPSISILLLKQKKNNSFIAIESPEFSKHVFSRSSAETSLFQNSVKLWIRLSQLKTHQLTILNFNSGKFFILLRPRYEHKYSTMNKDRTLYVVNSHVSANKSLCVHRRQSWLLDFLFDMYAHGLFVMI